MADPIEEQFVATMNGLAAGIDGILNGEGTKREDRKVGFVLGVFKFGELDEGQARFNYISNANRRDMVVLLKEMVARFEGQADTVGHG